MQPWKYFFVEQPVTRLTDGSRRLFIGRFRVERHSFRRVPGHDARRVAIFGRGLDTAMNRSQNTVEKSGPAFLAAPPREFDGLGDGRVCLDSRRKNELVRTESKDGP